MTKVKTIKFKTVHGQPIAYAVLKVSPTLEISHPLKCTAKPWTVNRLRLDFAVRTYVSGTSRSENVPLENGIEPGSHTKQVGTILPERARKEGGVTAGNSHEDSLYRAVS